MSATTTTTLQELLQCEEDSFIPDDLDDKFYDDNIYNWEVMFETVKLFVMKEGRWPRWHREEDKRDVIMADGSIKSRDLAQWMCNQRNRKFKGKLPCWSFQLSVPTRKTTSCQLQLLFYELFLLKESLVGQFFFY